MAYIRINDGCVNYLQKNGEKRVGIENVSISINKGELALIKGPNGSGKTTLLNVMAGLIPLEQGALVVDNNHVKLKKKKELLLYRRNNIGFVLQQSLLLDNLNVYNNIELPMKYSKVSNSVRNQRMKELIEGHDIKHLVEKMPYELSIGELQKISIIRAITTKPKLLLMDEPLNSLDEENANAIVKMVKGFKSETTIVVITHHDLFDTHSDRVFHLRYGKLV